MPITECGTVRGSENRLENSTSPVVLVIDDEPLVLGLERAILEDEGFTVFEAMSGPLGLGLIPVVSPQAVVLDVMMPGMDGVEVCARITESYPSLSVLILTARDDPALEDRCMAAGASHFLTKPFEPDRLIDLLWSSCGTGPPVGLRQAPQDGASEIADACSSGAGPAADALTAEEDDELRRLHWFSQVAALSDEMLERIIELRLRDRRTEIRPVRETGDTPALG